MWKPNVSTANCNSSSGDGIDWLWYGIMYHGGLLSVRHRGDRTTHARKNERARQGYTNHTHSEHANGTGHKPLWNETKFIDRESHWYTRKGKDRLNPNNINRDNGTEIPEAWMPTIRKHLNQRRTKNQRTPEETMVHGMIAGSKCTNYNRPPWYIMSCHNQSTPSPGEDMQ